MKYDLIGRCTYFFSYLQSSIFREMVKFYDAPKFTSFGHVRNAWNVIYLHLIVQNVSHIRQRIKNNSIEFTIKLWTVSKNL